MKKRLPKKHKKELSVVREPVEFFKQEITRASGNQKITIDPNTQYYLCNLLTQFMITENLFTIDEKGKWREEVLALLLHKALAAASMAVKQKDLRRLGDVSLYTAGFFGDSLSRKLVDIDYYIGMGRNAYGSLAQSQLDLGFRSVFLELAKRFHKFVDVFTEISYSSHLSDAKNILRLYDVWLKTKSVHAERTLKQAGLIPNKLVKPDWQ